MKTKFITAACTIAAILIATQSKAQHLSLYVHGLYASSLDKSSQKLYNAGYGLVGGITTGKGNTRFVASVGYTSFGSALSPTDVTRGNFGDETYIPVKIGIQQHLPLVLSFLYLQADAGAGFISYKSTSANDTRFAFDVGAGGHFGIFEAAVVWDSFTEKDPSGWSSWITLQAGLTFGL